MSRIKSRGNTTTELKLIKVFRQNEITGWRRNYSLFGSPDFVFPRNRLAVFVDGCFWHGHPQKCRMPRTNRKYWAKKIERNKARDRQVGKVLRKMGWTVIRIWENEVDRQAAARKIARALKRNEQMGR